MAETTRLFAHRHLRSEAASHIVVFRRGKQVRSGRGLSFWFDPDHANIMEIPADDRDTDFVFQARSRDYQVVTVQGTITWRAAALDALAARVDFTIDLRTGRLRTDPLDRIASLLIGLAQYQAARYGIGPSTTCWPRGRRPSRTGSPRPWLPIRGCATWGWPSSRCASPASAPARNWPGRWKRRSAAATWIARTFDTPPSMSW